MNTIRTTPKGLHEFLQMVGWMFEQDVLMDRYSFATEYSRSFLNFSSITPADTYLFTRPFNPQGTGMRA